MNVFWIKATGDRGNGVFAMRPFKQGEHVFTVEFGIPDQPFGALNHSCTPNCSLHRAAIFTARPITEGEELTINYTLIPFPILPLEFDCLCGHPNCKGRIKV